MNPRAGEYLCFLQEKFGNDLKIEATEWEAEWGKTHYLFLAYVKSRVITILDENGVKKFEKEGAVAFLDLDEVKTGDTFDDVIDKLFYYLFDKKVF